MVRSLTALFPAGDHWSNGEWPALAADHSPISGIIHQLNICYESSTNVAHSMAALVAHTAPLASKRNLVE
jgi:hypothetical protein